MRLGLPRLAWPSLSFPSFGTLGRVAAYATPAVLIALFALFLITSRDTGTAQASSLAVFSGGVERQIDGAWLPIESGAELSEGDRLRTTTDGRALITFADGSTVALEPSTELVLLRVRGDGAREIEIELFGRLCRRRAPCRDRRRPCWLHGSTASRAGRFRPEPVASPHVCARSG